MLFSSFYIGICVEFLNLRLITIMKKRAYLCMWWYSMENMEGIASLRSTTPCPRALSRYHGIKIPGVDKSVTTTAFSRMKKKKIYLKLVSLSFFFNCN